MKHFHSIAAAFALLLCTGNVNAFTVVNHATVAYIAQNHMTPKALRNYYKAFNNHTLMEFASYPDFYRAAYLVNGKTISHRVNFDDNLNPVLPKEGEALNAYGAILRAIEQLKDHRNLDDSTKYTALALLVHFMGDSHCPSHLRYADGRDRIETINYKIYRYKTKAEKLPFHSFWDSICTDYTFSESYVDRALIFDTCTPREIKEIQQGTLADWMHCSAVLCKDIFNLKEDQIVDRIYVTNMAGLAASQVRAAGYRLAALMNELFGK